MRMLLAVVLTAVAVAAAARAPRKAQAGKFEDLNIDFGGLNLGNIMCQTMDGDRDGEITRAEMNKMYMRYKDNDDMINAACGVLSQLGIDKSQCLLQRDVDGLTNLVMEKLDTNSNGMISMAECSSGMAQVKMPNMGENLMGGGKKRPGKKGRLSNKPADEL